MKFEDYREYKLLLTMKCCTDTQSPGHLQLLVKKVENNLRSNDTAKVPPYKTTQGQMQATYQGPIRWNNLSEAIRTLELKKFKRTIKSNYLSMYWTICESGFQKIVT